MLVSRAGEVKQVMVHFTQETQQRWAPPSGPGSEDGAMLWLPGGVYLELRMVSAVRSAVWCPRMPQRSAHLCKAKRFSLADEQTA